MMYYAGVYRNPLRIKIRADFGARRNSALFLCARRAIFYAVKQHQRIVTNLKILRARGNFCDIIKEKSLKLSFTLKKTL